MRWYLGEAKYYIKQVIKSGKIFYLRRKFARKNIYMRKVRINGDDFTKLIVGDNVYLNDAFLDLHDTITIEDHVGFGYCVTILTGSHDHTKFLQERARVITKPVVIKKGAWIASYAIILPGTEIGEHSVVSAGSVVKGKIPPYVLIGGNPAKIVSELKHF